MSRLDPKASSTTVTKALQILDLLGEEGKELGLSDCARRLRMNKSTVYRLLNTLKQCGYVRQNPNNEKYFLGMQVFRLALSLWKGIGLAELAEPHLRSLAAESGETVNLVVLDQGDCLYVKTIEGAQSVRMVAHIGMRDCLHSVSAGKAILAHLPKAEVVDILREKGMPQRTERTITDELALFRHLDEVRNRGYSIDNEENEEGCSCVGAPVFDASGRPNAAISIAGPTFRLTESRIDELGGKVATTARRISEELQQRGIRVSPRNPGSNPTNP